MADAEELELLRTTVRGALDSGASLPDLARMGFLGLLVAEEAGGSGWCPVEAATVAIEVGRGAGARGPNPGTPPDDAGLPWLEASLAAMALAGGDDHVRRDWLDPVLGGSRVVVVADGLLERDGAGTVSGAVSGVVASPDGVIADVEGSHILLQRGTAGLATAADPTSLDVALPAETWSAVGVVPVELGAACAPAELAAARRVMAAANMLGLLSGALERLIPYLSDRVAFGAHIASFQAIQHRIVDLFLLEFRSRVTVEASARALAARSGDRGQLAAAAHGFVAARVPNALDECIQLTGGIGFTWEYPLHHELRRAVALAAATGGPSQSRRRFALAGTGG